MATRELLFDESGHMHLRAVQMRAEEIKRTLDNLLQTLQYAPASLQWSDALDRFAVLNVQMQHLAAQLRPLLHHYQVHPRSVNQTNAPTLPIMLATRLLPEQEAERETVLGAADGPPQDAQACVAATAALNSLVDVLTSCGGPLDPKGPARTKLAGAARAAAAETGAKPPPQATAGATSRGDHARLLLAAASYGAGL